ncbi:MAG: hypothetical protein JO199_02775, partial [Candidatus Eremiobacteraeota bacterium]|nr:hypothetical protein [Candidatus Eremiobacteraeota bacterium]
MFRLLLVLCALSVLFVLSPQRALSGGASIPLHANSGDKPGFSIVASVGGGPERAFLFDTGSNGLWLYP